jgi:hypothetical protein
MAERIPETEITAMAKRKVREPAWKVVYRKKHGRKRYSFFSDGATGKDAFINLEKVFPWVTKNMVYISATKV